MCTPLWTFLCDFSKIKHWSGDCKSFSGWEAERHASCTRDRNVVRLCFRCIASCVTGAARGTQILPETFIWPQGFSVVGRLDRDSACQKCSGGVGLRSRRSWKALRLLVRPPCREGYRSDRSRQSIPRRFEVLPIRRPGLSSPVEACFGEHRLCAQEEQGRRDDFRRQNL